MFRRDYFFSGAGVAGASFAGAGDGFGWATGATGGVTVLGASAADLVGASLGELII